ncbi:dual specificity protein phosphatase 1 [Pelomyxa schiedti]|nr:dual specificity protein phosphatase 1 [Pelomyxa schiedti]
MSGGVTLCREPGCSCYGFEANKFKKNLCVGCLHDCVSHEGTTAEQQAVATLTRANNTPANNTPSVVEEGLCMGSMLASMNIAALKAHNITHIINCAKGLEVTWPKFKQFPAEFTYLNLNMTDDSATDLRPSLPQAISFYKEARAKGTTVFVHCAQGVSRSGSVTVAILMAVHNMPYSEALAKAKQGHAICQPNRHFEAQLQTMEAWIRSGCL